MGWICLLSIISVLFCLLLQRQENPLNAHDFGTGRSPCQVSLLSRQKQCEVKTSEMTSYLSTWRKHHRQTFWKALLRIYCTYRSGVLNELLESLLFCFVSYIYYHGAEFHTWLNFWCPQGHLTWLTRPPYLIFQGLLEPTVILCLIAALTCSTRCGCVGDSLVF